MTTRATFDNQYLSSYSVSGNVCILHDNNDIVEDHFSEADFEGNARSVGILEGESEQCLYRVVFRAIASNNFFFFSNYRQYNQFTIQLKKQIGFLQTKSYFDCNICSSTWHPIIWSIMALVRIVPKIIPDSAIKRVQLRKLKNYLHQPN